MKNSSKAEELPSAPTRLITVTHANGEFMVVIGTGPCGAAGCFAQMGFKPIILEQGKIVRERTKDTWGFWRNSVFKSKFQRSIRGRRAGTFSDALYSQIKDKRHSRKVLTES